MKTEMARTQTPKIHSNTHTHTRSVLHNWCGAENCFLFRPLCALSTLNLLYICVRRRRRRRAIYTRLLIRSYIRVGVVHIAFWPCFLLLIMKGTPTKQLIDKGFSYTSCVCEHDKFIIHRQWTNRF